MHFLIFTVQTILAVLLFPFKAVLWLVQKLRGTDGEVALDDGVDESYDFNEAQSDAPLSPDALNYDMQGYEDHEVSNKRGLRPAQGLSLAEGENENLRDVGDGNLLLDHHALFVRHEGRQVLVVDYVLPDVPSWLEYQTDIGHFTIVMTNGASAHIDLRVDTNYIADLTAEHRILLVTSGDGEKIVHHLMFMVK
jgi:hypothetical protein